MKEAAARGFTVAEAMVAVAIVVVAVLALGGMLKLNVQTNQGSEQRMDAAAVSQGILNDYAARLLANDWVPGVRPVTGVKGGFQFSLSASQTADASRTVLAVTLQPVDGSRMVPYHNETLVTVVNGGFDSPSVREPSSLSHGKDDSDGNPEVGKHQDKMTRPGGRMTEYPG